MKKNTENYTEIIPYPALRGMDLTGEGGLAYLENMYIDYEGAGDALESIVGYRRILGMKEKIHSFCLIGEGDDIRLVIHSGNQLYFGSIAERDNGIPVKKIACLDDGESYAISLGSFCLITDGKRLISVDKNGCASLISEDYSLVGCRCAVIYDGRIFLSGNPTCKGKIFISTPIYEDGISFTSSIQSSSDGGVLSLVTLDGYLMLLHEGGVICYKAAGDGSYPIAKVIDYHGIQSAAVILDRELLFMTDDGLMSLSIPTDGGDVRLRCHSEKISRMLLRDARERAKLNIWMGYLVIFCGERMYLADPRGKDGYDWYLISGVGGYLNDRRVYRYQRVAEGNCEAYPTPDEKAVGEIYSYGRENGNLVYYSVEGDKRYSVYPTAELYGGEFHPAKDIACHGKLMWFCAYNSLYLFNNDKRGKEPKEVAFAKNYPTFNTNLTADRIHPVYYSFAGHAPRCVAITKPRDNRPTRERGRIRSRVNLRVKVLSSGEIRVMDITDGQKESDRSIIPTKMNQTAKSKAESPTYTADFVTVSLPERAKDGESIQLCIVTDSFASPFGIDRIEYRPGVTENQINQKKGNNK